MRLISIFTIGLAIANNPTIASWFGSNKQDYSSWDKLQLKAWLDEHNIETPKGFSQKELQDLVKENWDATNAWTQEQYDQAQKVFSDLKDTTFESWDESRLREFLLKQGVISPSGPREKLVLAAHQHYTAYSKAASSFASSASDCASTKVYGDPIHQASKSASSAAMQATQTVTRALDNSKDYVYSTWDDNRLRSYLEEKGVIKPQQQATREQLLSFMHDSYAKAAEPAWEAWSDSYIHEWLVTHKVIKSDHENKRNALAEKMKYYYYTPQQHVWDTWSDSQMRQWLIEHNIIKKEAKLEKDKMKKLVSANYTYAADTIWSSWSDSDLRSWLITHGYLRSDAQVQRDHMVKLISEKYNEASTRSAEYLTWPDARLRAFLRSHDLPEEALPTDRPGLLQETRIRYIQASSRLEQIYAHLRELVSSGVSSAEETLGQVLDLLGGTEKKVQNTASEKYTDAEQYAEDAKEYIKSKKSEL